MKSLILIFFFNYLYKTPEVNAASADCLDFNSALNKCRSCRWDSYNTETELNLNVPVDPDKCLTKPNLNQVYSAKVIVTKSTASVAAGWTIYNDLRTALESLENVAEIYLEANIQIYLAKETHAILASDKKMFFRRKNITISLAPLTCQTLTSSIPCFADITEKAVVNIKTGNLYFFVSQSFSLENIAFNGADILVKPANRSSSCYTGGFCCSGTALESCVKDSAEDTADEVNYALFNVEGFIESPGLVLFRAINCEFNEVYSIFGKGNFQAV